MANYWAITIGINQYRHLQPLMHAQNDARDLHHLLTDSAGIASSHCALLSDLTTSVGDQAVYPDKPAIAEWIQTIAQQVGVDDVLWVFFSGYGVQVEGADYLLPIDGDPKNAKATGIAVADLIDMLYQLPTDKALLILDMNRAQGALAGQTIGTQTIELAKKHQIPLLLSCQPEQFSREALDLRQGLFTAALLEALRQERATLGELDSYISKRLPELCDHYWRPVQNAVGLVFDGQADTVVIPALKAPFTDVESMPVPVTEPVAVPVTVPETVPATDTDTVAASGSVTTGNATIGDTPATTAEAVDGSAVDSSAVDGSAVVPLRPEQTGFETDQERTSAIVPYDQGSTETVSGAKLRNWGLLALAILLLGGVLFRQPAIRTAVQDLSDRATALTGSGPDDASEEDSDGAVDSSADANADTSADVDTEPDANSPVPDETPDETPNETLATQPPVAASPDTVPTAAAGGTETATAASLIAQANASIEREQYSEALITLRQVPSAQRDGTFSEALARARAGAATAQQANASVLNDARTSIQPIQASQFSEAVAKARLIQPGEPFYEEAQQDIRSWSQVILDIAEGRAASGNLGGAIAAASVMPYDNAELYQTSRDRIAFWQQRQNSRAIIAEAQTIPRTGQASSYQKGIVKLREVSIEHPEYETAQRLADEWSQRIFSIAQARAAQGRLSEAVQAAVLVPAGTAAYEPTQQAIKRWQSEG